MKTALFAAAALTLVSSGCAREKASAADCDKSCAHVADLRLADQKSQMRANLHELDEQVDSAEEESGKSVALLKKQLAEGGPPWNPKAFVKLPAKTQRELAERHKWEENQLKTQREMALVRAQATVDEAKKKYQDLKVKFEAEEKKATAGEIKTCTDACLQRPAAFAQCLQRTQAVEDIGICERQ